MFLKQLKILKTTPIIHFNDHILFIIVIIIIVNSLYTLIFFDKEIDPREFLLKYLEELEKLIREEGGEDPRKDFLRKIKLFRRSYYKKAKERGMIGPDSIISSDLIKDVTRCKLYEIDYSDSIPVRND